ncbi:MAG: sugar-binding protein [Armatimonadota bacterium]
MYRRILFALLLCLGSCALPGLCADVAISTEAARPFETMRCFVPYTAKPVTLDGKLDEWAGRKPAVVLKKSTISAIGSAQGDITDDADLTVTVWLTWDRQHLYVAADVIDQALVGGAQGFRYDNVILGLRSPRYTSLSHSGSDVQYFMNYYPPGAPAPSLWGKGRYVVTETKTGYTVEAALPFDGMVLEPIPGLRVNWYVICIDSDPKGWGQLLGMGTREVLPGINQWAELRLLPPQTADFAGDLTVSPAQITAGDTVETLALIDARVAGGEISEVRIEDLNGAVKWRSAVKAPLKPGMSLPVRLRFIPPALPAGSYRTVVTFGKANARAEASAPLRVGWSEERAPAGPANMVGTVRAGRFAAPKLPPAYTPMPITRDTYLQYLPAAVQSVMQMSLEDLRAGKPIPLQGDWTYYNVQYPVLLYKVTGEQVFAEAARKMIREYAGKADSTPMPHGQVQFAVSYKLMKEAGQLPAEDEALWRKLMVDCARKWWAKNQYFEHGNNNRCFYYMMLYGIALKIDPTVPEAAIWKPYVEEKWQYYWKVRDVDENTSGYGYTDAIALAQYAWFMGYDEFFKDPENLYYEGRFMNWVDPSGYWACQGDGGHIITGYVMIGHFEMMAKVTRDGRYKWAAHRLFEHMIRSKVAANPQELMTFNGYWGGFLNPLLWALYYCDDTVAEKAPAVSELLTNKRIIRTTGAEWAKAWYFRMADEKVPNKFIFRSGGRPDDMYAMVELLGDAGHSLGAPTHVNLLTQNRAVLLMDQNLQSRRYHNLVHLEDLEGMQTPEEERITAPHFSDHANVTLATARVQGFQLLPVTEERSFVFVKNRFMVARDLLTFNSRGQYRASARWHGQECGRQSGANWVNLFYDAIEDDLPPFQRILTYDRDLLLWFTPRPDCRVTAEDLGAVPLTSAYGWHSYSPLEVRQEWTGGVAPGQQVHFTTVLVPHQPMWDMSKETANIRTIEDTPGLTVVAVRSRGWCWVAVNPAGVPITIGPAGGKIKTDARLLFLQGENGEKPEDGGISYGAAGGATFVEVNGKPLRTSKERTDIEWPL